MNEEKYIIIKIDDVIESLYINNEGTFLKVDKDLVIDWVDYIKGLCRE
jgi:hypothetical protein